MPMTCRVCGHKKRLEIDRALLEGQSLRDIARRTGTTASSLQRHKAEHLARDLVKAHEAREVARADSLLDDVRTAVGRAERLYGMAEDILDETREAKDRKTALDAIRAAVNIMAEARQYLELRGELTGELPNLANAAGNVNLIRVLSVPRMPGVQTVQGLAIEPERQVGLPADGAVVALPEPEEAIVPARNRSLGAGVKQKAR